MPASACRPQRAGLSVPGDVALVSFDDDEISSYLRRGLTTIGLPHEQTGRMAVDPLLVPQGRAPILMPMPLIMRGSLPSV